MQSFIVNFFILIQAVAHCQNEYFRNLPEYKLNSHIPAGPFESDRIAFLIDVERINDKNEKFFILQIMQNTTKIEIIIMGSQMNISLDNSTSTCSISDKFSLKISLFNGYVIIDKFNADSTYEMCFINKFTSGGHRLYIEAKFKDSDYKINFFKHKRIIVLKNKEISAKLSPNLNDKEKTNLIMQFKLDIVNDLTNKLFDYSKNIMKNMENKIDESKIVIHKNNLIEFEKTKYELEVMEKFLLKDFKSQNLTTNSDFNDLIDTARNITFSQVIQKMSEDPQEKLLKTTEELKLRIKFFNETLSNTLKLTEKTFNKIKKHSDNFSSYKLILNILFLLIVLNSIILLITFKLFKPKPKNKTTFPEKDNILTV